QPVEGFEHCRGKLEERTTTEAASLLTIGTAQAVGPLNGGVGDDQSIKAAFKSDRGDILKIGLGKVRRNLQQKRRRFLREGAGYTGEELFQLLPGLQGAQSRCLGGGDIHVEVVGEGRQLAGSQDIILCRVERFLVLPK